MDKTIKQCIETATVFYKMMLQLEFDSPEMMIVAMFLKEAASSSVTQALNNRQSKGLMIKELEKVMKHGRN